MPTIPIIAKVKRMRIAPIVLALPMLAAGPTGAESKPAASVCEPQERTFRLGVGIVVM